MVRPLWGQMTGSSGGLRYKKYKISTCSGFMCLFNATPCTWVVSSQEAKKGNKAPFLVFSITAHHQEPSTRANRKCSSQFHLLAFGHFLFLPGILSELSPNSCPQLAFQPISHLLSHKAFCLVSDSPENKSPSQRLNAGTLFEIDPRKQTWGVWWVKEWRKNQYKVYYEGGLCQDLLRSLQLASQKHPPVRWETGAAVYQLLLYLLPSCP